jgi:hypothetical protein
VQFAIGSVLSLIFWATGFVKPPKLDAKLVGTCSSLRTQCQGAPMLLVHGLDSAVKVQQQQEQQQGTGSSG